MSVTKAALLHAIQEVRLAKAVLLQDFENLDAAFLKLEQAADRTMPVTNPPGGSTSTSTAEQQRGGCSTPRNLQRFLEDRSAEKVVVSVKPKTSAAAANKPGLKERKRLMTKQDLCAWIGKRHMGMAAIVDLATAQLGIERSRVYSRVGVMLSTNKGILFEKVGELWRVK